MTTLYKLFIHAHSGCNRFWRQRESPHSGASKDSYTDAVKASSEILVPQSITIESNDGPGKRIITFNFEDGSTLRAIGSFNADGSTGIFKVRAGESAEAEPDTLGIMILQELSGG